MSRKPPAYACDRLKQFVDADGRSVREIARAAGTFNANLRKILDGRTEPRAGTLAAILAVLGKRWKDMD